MKARGKGREDVRERLIVAAMELIREAGGFDFHMKDLVARGRVSLREPYDIFGSKPGVIAAVWESERARFVAARDQKPPQNAIDRFFRGLRLGVDFFASEEVFYRSLFWNSSALTADHPDPARENHAAILELVGLAQAQGLIEPDLDPDCFATVMVDLFSSGVRQWSRQAFPTQALYPHIAYGYALALSSVALGAEVERLRGMARDFQATLGAARA
jgi:AcrR family transcriptional regulator